MRYWPQVVEVSSIVKLFNSEVFPTQRLALPSPVNLASWANTNLLQLENRNGFPTFVVTLVFYPSAQSEIGELYSCIVRYQNISGGDIAVHKSFAFEVGYGGTELIGIHDQRHLIQTMLVVL